MLTLAAAWCSAFTAPMGILPTNMVRVPTSIFMAAEDATSLGAASIADAAGAKASLYDPLAVSQIEAEADATFDAIDGDDSGVISSDELRSHLTSIGYAEAAADKLFELLDTDGNGELTREELRIGFVKYSQDPSLQATLRKELDLSRVHAEADAFFDALDTDGDGAVSSEELRSHVASVGYEPAAAERFFKLLDNDQNGEITRDELRDAFVRYEDPALRLALGLGTNEADAIFAAIDVNSDGSIEEAELQNYLVRKGYPAEAATTIFATLDVDGDGTISKQELQNGYVRYAALREALGLKSSGKGGGRGKKQPIRWGRGNRKGGAPAVDASA